MNENLAASQWAAARGEKWRAQLAGMEAMLTPVDEPLIRALRLDAPYRIADVGCGGGGTTMEIARRATAGSVVHGFDISPALIESARARASSDRRAAATANASASAGVDANASADANIDTTSSTINFAVADVATAPAPDVPYDRLVSRFGIMFYDDPPAAFANLARWLAPGGRFAFAIWGRPADNPWMASVREAAADVIDVPATAPDAPSAFRYAGADSLLALLDCAGFADLDTHDWRGKFSVGGGLPAAEAARFALASFSVGELLAQAGDAAVDAVHRGLASRYSRHEQNGVVRMDACVHMVTGARMAAHGT